MALSISTGKKAFQVCHHLQLRTIPSRPKDISNGVKGWEKENPEEFTLYGNDQKADGGWEELMFFVKKKNLDQIFVKRWKDQKGEVPSSSYGPIEWGHNADYFVFGWF